MEDRKGNVVQKERDVFAAETVFAVSFLQVCLCILIRRPPGGGAVEGEGWGTADDGAAVPCCHLWSGRGNYVPAAEGISPLSSVSVRASAVR